VKKIVFLLIYYFFINNVVIKADLNIDRLIITNMEIGTDLVVYECQETEDSIHFIVIYDIKNDTYHRLLNNYDGYINDDLLYPSISSNDEYITYTSSATNISDDEIQYCYGYFDDILKPCSGIYIYDIETKKSLLIKNNDEYLNNNSFLSKINSSGEYVVFESAATNGLNVFFNECLYNNINQCTNIYKYHIETKHLQLVSTKYDNYGSNFNSINPSISGDGRYITFQSAASNLSNINNRCLNKDEDNRNICSNVYMYDSKFNVIKPISSYNNELLDDSSGNAVISKDGKFVVFESYSNMLSSSKNNKKKLFLYDLNSDNLKLISKKNNNINNRDCNLIDLSADGKYALFDTNSTNFNSNGVRNIFVINVFNSKFSWVSEYEKIKNVKFSGKNIAFFDKGFHFNKIDDVSPKIDKNQSIYVVKDNVYDLASKLIYSDNLSSNMMLKYILVICLFLIALVNTTLKLKQSMSLTIYAKS
jgi:hypothetical protein